MNKELVLQVDGANSAEKVHEDIRSALNASGSPTTA